VIEHVLAKTYKQNPDATSLPFTTSDILESIRDLELQIGNKNDIAYAHRSGRRTLPQTIEFGNWAITGVGRAKYEFVRLKRSPYVEIPRDFQVTRILDATPQIVAKYQSVNEQSLLARIRYNRLVDTFTSLTAYSSAGTL
jgi:hypothetical protein